MHKNTQLKNIALDNLPVPVCVFDDEMELLYFNKKFFDLFNSKLNIKLNNSVGETFNCPNVSEANCGKGANCNKCEIFNFFRAAAKLKNLNQILKFETADQNRLNFDCSVTKVKDKFIVVFKDVTKQTQSLALFEAKSKFITQDLKHAQTIQNNLLPTPIDTFPLVDFQYFYSQQYSVGGDFFDVYKIDNNHFGVYIADVSGMGVSSSMITIFIKNYFDKKEKSPARALMMLCKKFLTLQLEEEKYITIFSMIFDTQNHKFYFCNAGHNQPSILKHNGSTKSFLCDGQPLGNWGTHSFEYRDFEGQYAKGDKLVLYTDGLADMKNPNGEFYGDEKLEDAILKSPAELNSMLNYIAKDFVDFTANEKLCDDFTLLVLDLIR